MSFDFVCTTGTPVRLHRWDYTLDHSSFGNYVYDDLTASGHYEFTFMATDEELRAAFYSYGTNFFTLDNVRITIGNRYTANVVSYSDYYAFGMQLPGRHGVQAGADGYRYGFQGQEMDDEIKGEGNSINFEFRMHDPRIGRFFAVDPLAAKYPHNSPYAFSENVVIDHIELEGLEKIQYQKKDKGTNEYSDKTQKRDVTQKEIDKLKGEFGIEGTPQKNEFWRVTDVYEDGKVVGIGFERWEYNENGERVKLNQHVKKSNTGLSGTMKAYGNSAYPSPTVNGGGLYAEVAAIIPGGGESATATATANGGDLEGATSFKGSNQRVQYSDNVGTTLMNVEAEAGVDLKFSKATTSATFYRETEYGLQDGIFFITYYDKSNGESGLKFGVGLSLWESIFPANINSRNVKEQ